MTIAEADLREAFCEVGRRVWQKDYVASNDGNFSFRLSEDRVLCTPTLQSKGFMRPEDMVVVDLDGTQVSTGKRTTSEIRLHLHLYRRRPDIHSVVHVHPPHATAFAITRRELPKCVLPEVELFLGEIPLAPYETTGTWEFAKTLDPWIATHDAFLLTNHGAVTVGQDPFDAYYKMETLDQYCRILLLAAPLGDWRRIEPRGIAQLLRLKEKLGIPDPRRGNPCTPGAARDTKPAPAEPFRPHAGPLTDAPKLMGSKPPAPDGDVQAVVAEVLRRLQG